MGKSNTKIANAYSPSRKSGEHKPRHSSERSADDKDIDYHRYVSKGSPVFEEFLQWSRLLLKFYGRLSVISQGG